MSTQLNESLRKSYDKFDVPADALVTSPDLRLRFANDVRTGAGQPELSTDEVMRALLRLRKNGGLPRLRR